jgi:hypothetical protein
MMAKFRKKPTVIEAEQFFSDCQPLPFSDKNAVCYEMKEDRWFVVTIHGQETTIVDGDWIIPEPDGVHFYPCKPDIFQKTYDRVDNE